MTMAKNGFKTMHKAAPAKGRDAGIKALGEATSYQGCCVAEYVWIDGAGQTRSKSKTVTAQPKFPDDCGIWMCNASATGQGTVVDSDIYLVPRAVFNDPFRGAPNVMVVCEAVTNTMEAAPGNYRALCAEVCDKYKHAEPWFGFEQEYYLSKLEKMGSVSNKTIGLNADGTATPGMHFYCGVGGHVQAQGLRDCMDDHYACCLAAGVKLTGINAETGPGQCEFQVGPCLGVSIGDHMVAARHILAMVCEKYGFVVNYSPKPHPDMDGSGCHLNFSTKMTRTEGGLTVLEKICRGLAKTHATHLQVYGEGNDARLTGKHQTAPAGEFSFGSAQRGFSVRIPRNVAMTGRGHLEDRRPAANCDPYRVAGQFMKTVGESLGSLAHY